jgi:hypothetical protein
MATLVHKSEYARRRGVHRSAITIWQRKGFLVFSEDGRLVNVEASDALLDARPAVHNGGVCSPPSGSAKSDPTTPAPVKSAAPDWTTAEAIRRKESANALMRQLEYELKTGRLLPADEVEALWRGHVTDARKRLLTVPSRCASRLSHLSRAEVEVIDREIRDALQDLVGSVNKSE